MQFFIKTISVVVFVLWLGNSVFAQEDLNVIHGKNQWLHYTDARNALYHHFAKEAYQQLEERKSKISGYRSLSDWKHRQDWIRKTLHEIAGPFPEKTPLNAKVLRTIAKDSYRVEHIIFESRPRFYVSSSLFIPNTVKKTGKAPVVIYCSGHAEEGYRSKVYQHVILNLVKKGFIVFAFDPVGQGERLEYYDTSTGKSSVGGPTTEHSYPGTQAFIAGSSQARYMIWDGIRAVDYLLTRKEIDPTRIGITGRSGGGTQSSYIAALDDRIRAAAPECYITGFTRLLQSIGPQDAEQNLFNGISKGIDHGDLLIVRAPKPALMITTTRDMFSIQGARETASEISEIYKAYGGASHFAMVEDDAPHASTKKNREAMYAFFQKYLNNAGNATDEEVPLLSAEEIRVTHDGQVSASLGGETVWSLNRAEVLAFARPTYSTDAFREIIDQAKKLSGYRAPVKFEKAVFTGRIQRDGYVIEKYFVRGEGDYVIPFLFMVPTHPAGKTILYLHPAGKATEALPEGEIEWFVRNGNYVIAPDLPGTGEMAASDFQGDAFIGGVSHNIWYSSMLIGRSIVGLNAGDIQRILESLEVVRSTEVYGLAKKEMTPALLHAAAFIPSIKKIALIEPLSTYLSLVTNRYYHSPFIMGAVPGALKVYDLPDLAASLAPRGLLIVNPVDGKGEKMSDALARETFDIVQQAYKTGDQETHLMLWPEIPPEKLKDLLKEWTAN